MMEENRKLRAEFEKLGAVKRAVANRLASALGDLNRHKQEKEQEVYNKGRREEAGGGQQREVLL
jgi:hypothetical protein